MDCHMVREHAGRLIDQLGLHCLLERHGRGQKFTDRGTFAQMVQDEGLARETSV